MVISMFNKNEYIQEALDTQSIGLCVVTMVGAIAQYHLYHLVTKSKRVHESLNTLYNDLVDVVDHLAESYVGMGNTLPSYKIALDSNYSDAKVMAYTEDLLVMVNSAIEITNTSEYMSVNKHLVDIQDLMVSFKYFMGQS